MDLSKAIPKNHGIKFNEKNLLPFNVKILELTQGKLRGLGQTTSLDYFDNITGEYHDEGLFSLSIFGMLGDKNRKKRFGFIDIKVEVFHPVIFKAITTLRRFYLDIITGTKYAVFNEKLKDFEEATQVNGETGYNFFLTHWKKIKFKETDSNKRGDKIKVIEQYKDIALTSKIVVLPAGLRDMEVNKDGRPTSDEVNDIYRKLISISNTIPNQALRSSPEILDMARLKAQSAFNELYDYFEAMIKGKKKLFMNKFASRNIQNSTRNVISAMIPSVADLDDEKTLDPNSSVVGTYQTAVMIRPVTYQRLTTGILSNIFLSPNTPARLINPKNYQVEDVRISNEDYDLWMTNEGLDKVLYLFKNPDMRHEPIKIGDHYLALVYTGEHPRSKKEVFKVFYDIRDLPKDFDKSKVRPLTYIELIYITIYPVANEYPILATRYPISGADSVYPSFIYLKSTTNSTKRFPLDDNWEVMNKRNKDYETYPALEYPDSKQPFFDTFSVSFSKLGGVGGD